MNRNGQRRRGRVAAALLATAVLSSTAAPALADERVAAEACWTNADTAVTQCFDDETALADAVHEQTGTVLLEEGQQARGVLATYIISRLYVDSGYGGSVRVITSSSSTICAIGSVSGNLTGAWNDVVSSFHSYYGCTTYIYENTGQGGAVFAAVNASSVGSMNDRASSYRIT